MDCFETMAGKTEGFPSSTQLQPAQCRLLENAKELVPSSLNRHAKQTHKPNSVCASHVSVRITPRPAPSPASCLWFGSSAPAAERRRTRQARVMKRQLELAALGVAATGWLAAILTRCLALWTVSGTLDNTTASLPAYWDGVWLEWDHWDLAHDGSLHCSFYRSLMSLSGSFRTWRALVTAAIGAGGFAAVTGGVGLVWFPTRGQIKVFSGSFFVVAGILLLVPTAWTCHHTSQPLHSTVPLRRDWGPALYLGWISFALMLVGGVFLTTRCPTAGEQPARSVNSEAEAGDPLSTINRTAFTNSQYKRRSEPI